MKLVEFFPSVPISLEVPEECVDFFSLENFFILTKVVGTICGLKLADHHVDISSVIAEPVNSGIVLGEPFEGHHNNEYIT